MSLPEIFFYSSSGSTITTLSFGDVVAGQQSETVEIQIWNNKGSAFPVDTAKNITITVRNGNVPEFQDPVTRGWVRGRSSGISNPSNQPNFLDDAQETFSVLDGNVDLEIGDLPNNCGRTLFFKLDVPTDTSKQSEATFHLIAGAKSPSSALPFFFNRAFGDGIVDNTVPQIFPPVLSNKTGFWTDLLAISSGRYTGNIAKQYLLHVTGQTIGVATYSTSDDDGVTFSSATITSLTSATTVFTSNDVDEGVRIRWSSASGQTFGDGDQWTIDVDIDPFSFKTGATDALTGYVGGGEALIYNNRILHNTPTAITGLTTNARNYVFLDAAGAFSSSVNGNPQAGKLKMGWFDTSTEGATQAKKFALPTMMGQDVLSTSDFSPVLQSLVGLTFTYNRGRYKFFENVRRIPSLDTFQQGTLSILPGSTNYIQIDPILDDVVTRQDGYIGNNIPLYRVVGNTFFDILIDDRTAIGVSEIFTTFVGTISNVPTGSSQAFSFENFAERSTIQKTIITPTQTGTGYTVSFYGDSGLTNLQYSAGSLTNNFEDNFLYLFRNTENQKKLHGFIENQTGSTSSFSIQLEHWRSA